eukprot:TRINITY_DN5148_c0_g1_i1.p1 TRINITY_DN5148_c0_g1~~TRINITY_DN5148_c0_g1_i1.p1  ORF type:complete len:112 (-),score=13.59 TRINITY_DN5148_c0_g1_i1:174-509(-)
MLLFFFLMIRRPPRSTHCISSAASDVYKRQVYWVYSCCILNCVYCFGMGVMGTGVVSIWAIKSEAQGSVLCITYPWRGVCVCVLLVDSLCCFPLLLSDRCVFGFYQTLLNK